MDLGLALHNLGAVATLALGALGLLRPRSAAALVRLEPLGKLGLAELRATYGGLFAAAGAFVLFAQDGVAFALLGAAWLGTAAARLLSVWIDGASEPRNLAAVVLESALAVLLLAPA